jgi:hypothetical protein
MIQNHEKTRFTISLLKQAGVYDTYMTVLLQVIKLSYKCHNVH